MAALKKVIGVVFIIVAAIVAIHTVIEPLYYTSTTDNPYSPVWKNINIIMAISIVLGLIFSCLRLVQINENSSVQEFIAGNTLFYGFIFIGILFFWNWFGIPKVKVFTAAGPETRSIVWIIVDATLPLLNGVLGIHLLRTGNSK